MRVQILAFFFGIVALLPDSIHAGWEKVGQGLYKNVGRTSPKVEEIAITTQVDEVKLSIVTSSKAKTKLISKLREVGIQTFSESDNGVTISIPFQNSLGARDAWIQDTKKVFDAVKAVEPLSSRVSLDLKDQITKAYISGIEHREKQTDKNIQKELGHLAKQQEELLARNGRSKPKTSSRSTSQVAETKTETPVGKGDSSLRNGQFVAFFGLGTTTKIGRIAHIGDNGLVKVEWMEQGKSKSTEIPRQQVLSLPSAQTEEEAKVELKSLISKPGISAKPVYDEVCPKSKNEFLEIYGIVNSTVPALKASASPTSSKDRVEQNDFAVIDALLGKFSGSKYSMVASLPDSDAVNFNEKERQAYKIIFKNGLAYDSHGKKVNFGPEEIAIYVMDGVGNFYAANQEKMSQTLGKRFQHSSFMAGEPVASAGVIKIQDGKITSLSNTSGHYKPTPYHFSQAVKELEKQGVTRFHKALIGWKSGDKSNFEFEPLSETGEPLYLKTEDNKSDPKSSSVRHGK